MRKAINSYRSWDFGPSAWEEVRQIEAKLRQLRKDVLYRKEKLKRQIIEVTLALLLSAAAFAGLAVLIYFIGKQQGKW